MSIPIGGPSQDLLRQIPQVEKLLRLGEIEALIPGRSRIEVTDALRVILDEARQEAMAGRLSQGELTHRLSGPGLLARVQREIEEHRLSAYRRVVNATGIILHTGLGRAVLSKQAVESFARELCGYSIVELDVDSGERNCREEPLVKILRNLTGAESATVVNNNAGATLLVLAALARGKEVIVSRGQLVEIGGSFRIPDILRESGARLVEVGTTNRTYASDYRRALTHETAMLLQVHTSNYEIAGFVHQTPLEELVTLGQERGLTVVSDLGSGCFIDLSPYGFKREPLASESVKAGADIVCFSGDKLLGGPQCGVIVGKEKSILALRAHPLFRALRVDKCTLVLLEATLRAYQDPKRILELVPALRLIQEPVETVRLRAEKCLNTLLLACKRLELALLPSAAQAGSGSLPTQTIPSYAIQVRHATLSPDAVAKSLRLGPTPIFSRVHSGSVLLDFRTVLEGEDELILRALEKL